MTASSVRNLVLALATASAFCAMVPSCADNNSSIFIRQFQKATAPECTLNSDPTAVAVFGGLLDLGVTTTYVAYPLIANQLVGRGDPKLSKAEANRVAIQGAEISLQELDGREIVPAYTVLAIGTIDAATSTDPAFGVTAIEVVPSSVGDTLRKSGSPNREVKATIKVFGKTLGGRDVETGPVDFPLQLCIGCTVVASIDPTTKTVTCETSTSGGSGTTQRQVCNPGQDDFTPCSLCEGRTICTPCGTDMDCSTFTSPTTGKTATCNPSTHLCQ